MTFVVCPGVRKVEAEIDDIIRNMAVWKVKRNVLLMRLVTIWRDGLELVNMMAAHAAMFHLEEGIQNSIAGEHLMATGAFQALKWAMEYARHDGIGEVSDETLVELVMKVAGPYQALVDALKLGAHDMAEFSVDWDGKTLTVYEGGNVSGHDAAMALASASIPLSESRPTLITILVHPHLHHISGAHPTELKLTRSASSSLRTWSASPCPRGPVRPPSEGSWRAPAAAAE